MSVSVNDTVRIARNGKVIEVVVTRVMAGYPGNPEFDGYRTDYPEMTIYADASEIIR